MLNLLFVLHDVLSAALEIYSVLLIIYILMSWFPNAYQSTFGQLLARICEPYLEIFRRFIPPIGMISISGIVALFVLNLASSGLDSIFVFIYRLILS
ncbi:MAG: YggT family protein [Desemzia incerta]|uniref:YggT family protein n=2 Tax=Desemzia incerta TaxID=82801 RepID=A0A1I5VWH1_9LACT|nr:YggT family protein [Desemzia incerta]MCI3029440.1 YggT family protein [Desemzia sp. C1]SFQ11336.1 YggT family protein [Desemzia incerta]